MTSFFLLLLPALALGPVRAAEHPAEHPREPSAAPAAPAAPAAAAAAEEAEASEPAPNPEEIREDIAGTVAGIIEVQSDQDGFYKIKDQKLKKDWKLKVVDVPAKKVAVVDETRSIAHAEFRSADGKHTVDVDFHMQRHEEGGFAAQKVLVHAVDGRQRFDYDKDHNIVPVKAKGAGRKPARKKSRKR